MAFLPDNFTFRLRNSVIQKILPAENGLPLSQFGIEAYSSQAGQRETHFLVCPPIPICIIQQGLTSMSKGQGRLSMGGVNGMGASRKECQPHWDEARGQASH